MKHTAPKLPYLRLRVERSAAERRVKGSDIVAAVDREHHAGRLPSGCRLPPVRVLQHQLGIAKNTVQRAYDELVARGIVENRERLGYFIVAPDKPHPRSKPLVPSSPTFFEAHPTQPARKPARGTLNLGSVFIDTELLPRERLAQCFRAVLKDPGLPTTYTAQGFAPLRALIAKRLAKRAIPAKADDEASP